MAKMIALPDMAEVTFCLTYSLPPAVEPNSTHPGEMERSVMIHSHSSMQVKGVAQPAVVFVYASQAVALEVLTLFDLPLSVMLPLYPTGFLAVPPWPFSLVK